MNEPFAACDPTIVAGTASRLSVSLGPSRERDSVVRIGVGAGLSVGVVALAFEDGTPLACRVRRKGSQYVVRCGPVRTPATLTAELIADVPVVTDRAVVDVAANDRSQRFEVRLHGRPFVVAERCLIAIEPNPVEPGSAFALIASLVNDGTVASEAELHLRLPDGVFAPSPPERAWWSLDECERRVLVVPTASLQVGEALELLVPMELDGVVAGANELIVHASVCVAGVSHALRPAVIAVRAHAAVEVVTLLAEPARTFRYGQRIEMALRVRGLGNDAAHGVAISVCGDFICWENAGPQGELTLNLGTVLPGSEATLVCTGRVSASPAKPETRSIEPVASASHGDVRVRGTPCTLNGEARLDARGFVEDVDPRGCHEVRVVLTNVGDGEAESLALRTLRLPGLRAVVDSLAVDGEPVYEPDGSLRIETPAGLTLGSLGIRATRTVTWLVRSTQAATYAIPLWLRDGERERYAEIVADLADGTTREAVARCPAPDLEAFGSGHRGRFSVGGRSRCPGSGGAPLR